MRNSLKFGLVCLWATEYGREGESRGMDISQPSLKVSLTCGLLSVPLFSCTPSSGPWLPVPVGRRSRVPLALLRVFAFVPFRGFALWFTDYVVWRVRFEKVREDVSCLLCLWGDRSWLTDYVVWRVRFEEVRKDVCFLLCLGGDTLQLMGNTRLLGKILSEM